MLDEFIHEPGVACLSMKIARRDEGLHPMNRELLIGDGY